MATVLDNIGIVENADLAKMEGSKSIKTKPTTFTGTKNYYNEQLNMGLEKESTVVELTDEEREKLIQKVEKLKRMETELSAREIVSRVHFGASKPIKIKPVMYGNINQYYGAFQISELEKQNEIANVQVIPTEIESKSLEQIQNEEIEKMLENIRKEKEPVFESKSLEQIQNEEVEKLMSLIKTKELVENSKSIVEIEKEEIEKLLSNEKPLRDEIQIVPDRPEKYQDIIDKEFADQEVTMISSEEVEQAVKPDITQTETPTKVSKYSQKEINMEKDAVIRMIENSIAEALKKIKKDEGKDIDHIFADIYEEKKKEVSKKFDQIEKETGKSVEDIFAEIYLKNRRNIDQIFTDLYGNIDKKFVPEKKSIEDYFAEIYTNTGKNVEEIFADIYEQEPRQIEDIFNRIYQKNQNAESIDNIFQAIYSKLKKETKELFNSFKDTTGNSIDQIFTRIYGATGKNVDQIFSETFGTQFAINNKTLEDRFTEIRIGEGKNADQVVQDIYQQYQEQVDNIFNKVVKPEQIINNMNNRDQDQIKIQLQPIKERVTFEQIFNRAPEKSAKQQKRNVIHFDYSRVSNKDAETTNDQENNKSELSEILRIVREKQNQKSNLGQEIEKASQTKASAEQERLRATLELERKEKERKQAVAKVKQYLNRLEMENEADMNKIENMNKASEDIYHQAEDLSEQARREQEAIDQMYETIGKVSLRSVA